MNQVLGFSIERRYDASYWETEPEWLPRRAEIVVEIEGNGADDSWRELEFALSSGPAENYRYFPFQSMWYVDDRLQAIAEFGTEYEDASVTLRVPVGRKAIIRVVNELGDVPLRRQFSGDERELAIVLSGVRLGSDTTAPPKADLEDFDRQFTQQLVPLVRELPRPIFVIGSYRSGTSIATWALGQHPNIWVLEETGWFPLLGIGALAGQQLSAEAKRSFFDIYDISQAEYMAHCGSAIDDFVRKASMRRTFTNMRELLSGNTEGYNKDFQLARSNFSPKMRWVDGTPENALSALLLRRLFPAAKFVAMVRKPLDVISSMIHFARGGGQAVDAKGSAQLWTQRTKACLLAWRAFGPDVVKLVTYESLISDPKPCLRAILDFLGEPWFDVHRVLDTKINSSKVEDPERVAIHRYVSQQGFVGEVEAVYAEAARLMHETWQPDPMAETTLAEQEWDIVSRAIHLVR